jgi:hypothetical protein
MIRAYLIHATSIMKNTFFSWMLCLFGFVHSTSLAQPTHADPQQVMASLNQIYLSEEFSAIHRQLTFPTAQPSLAQRTDETKATKLQVQTLNSWQREFEIRLARVVDAQKNAHSPNAKVYQQFSDSVVAIYQRLKNKKINFRQANQDLVAAQKMLVLDAEAPRKERTGQENSTPRVPPSYTPAPQQPPQAAPTTPTPPVRNAKTNASSKSVCDQKQILLDSLLQEKENWESVTSSLNQSLKQALDRATAQQTQDMQSVAREEKIKELSMYRTKHCL